MKNFGFKLLRLDTALEPSRVHCYFLLALCLILGAFFVSRYESSATSEPNSIAFEPKVLDGAETRNPAKARELLRSRPTSLQMLPEGDHWISFKVDSGNPIEILELRLLRPLASEFWIASDVGSITGLRRVSSKLEKGGVSVYLDADVQVKGPFEVVARLQGAPSIRPKLIPWEKSNYEQSMSVFARAGGELVGAFLALAVFCALVGVLNRDNVFVVFGGWLVTSGRVSLVNNGWDSVWFGASPSFTGLQMILSSMLALHAMLTLRLFRGLFANNFSNTSKLLSAALEGALILVFFSSFFLPRSIFYPILWSFAFLSICFIAAHCYLILRKNFTSTFGWYAGGWIATLGGLLSEILRAVGLLGSEFSWINSRVGAVTGALLTAVALAERMRIDRQGRLKAETKAKLALQRFKENYNSVPVGLATIDMQGDIRHYNPSFQAIFGVTQTTTRQSINKYFAPVIFNEIRDRLRTASETSLRVAPKDTASGDRAFSIQASIRDNLIEASFQEITKEYEAEIRMKRLAHYDTLTDFLNRRGLEKALKELQPALEVGSTALSIAYFDLDKFKLINDLYGYQSGDEVIKEMGRRLSSVFRAPNMLCRAAGDEFIVLMVGSEGEVAKNLCRHAVMEINERSYQVGGKSFNCHVSVGIATVSAALSIKDALAFADRACREAKNSQGDERIVLFDPNEESFKRLMGEAKIEAQMGQDLPLDRFFIVAQPIVSLQSPGSNFNYEILVRMHGDNNEVLNPGHFLKAIERNGLVSQLDRFVLRSTLQWLYEHPKHVEKLTYASVNLSGGSLNDHRFLEDALALMQDFRELAPKICFEITESVALGDIKNTRHFAERVKSMGCMLALDDFGAGYTSFAYMKEFPADVVKIDGAYVRNMRRRSMDYAIVRAVTDLSHEIGMSVVAEWAETPDLISSLARMGVDYGQGWALGKPMEMDRLLEGHCAADFVLDAKLKTQLMNPPQPKFRKPGIFIPAESEEFSGLVIPAAR